MTKKMLENSKYGTKVTWNAKVQKERPAESREGAIDRLSEYATNMMAMKIDLALQPMAVHDIQAITGEIRDALCLPVKIISSFGFRATLISLLLDCLRKSAEHWYLHLDQAEIELCVDDRCGSNVYVLYEDRSEVRAEEFAHLDELP